MREPMQFAAGNQIVTVEPAKRRGIRWAVGSLTGLRSSTWRCWGHKSGDVYVAVRTLGGTMKTSLHRDGRCHSGFTRSFFDALLSSGRQPASRHMDRWTVPLDARTCALQVLVPAAELRVFEGNETQTRWLPSPTLGSVMVVSVLVGPHAQATEDWPGAQAGTTPVGVMVSRTRVTWVVAHEEPLDAALAVRINEFRADLTQRWPLRARSSVRALLAAVRDNGQRVIVELAWSPPPTSIAA